VYSSWKVTIEMPAAAADDEWEPPAREAEMGEVVSMEQLRVRYAPDGILLAGPPGDERRRVLR
jgi:hypothetical protein